MMKQADGRPAPGGDYGGPSGGAVEIVELLSAVWENKWVVTIVIVLSALGSIFMSLSLPDVYKAEALLAASHESDSGMANLSAQYGGIAGLAGINIGGFSDGTSRTDVAMATLRSRKFFSTYLYDSVVVDLWAANSWDSITGKLVYDREIFDIESGVWVRSPIDGVTLKPTIQEAHSRFIQSFQLTRDSMSGLITISVENISPITAKEWLDRIIDSINSALRNEDIRTSKNAIDYLVSQQKSTSVVSLSSAFSQLIEEQTKTMMLASVSDEYAFRVIDPAVVPETRARPNRFQICFVGTLLGVLSSLVYCLVHYYRNRIVRLSH